MDGQKISEIEDFANINSNIKMLGYDPATNKPGMVNIATLQSKIPYCGVRFAKANSSPEGEPIGDLQMLQQLPSILGLGGYLVKNDHSRQKLDASNHFKLASGGAASSMDQWGTISGDGTSRSTTPHGRTTPMCTRPYRQHRCQAGGTTRFL